MTQQAYFINHTSHLLSLPKSTGRIYTGSDYCIKAFPRNFRFLLLNIKKSFPVTLLIPPVLESELTLLEKYLEVFISLAEENDEIICNDLGMLKVISSMNKRRFKIGLGRFFSYQKRGVQKLYDAVKDEDLRDIPILEKETIAFLKNLDVERVEVDAVTYGLNMPDKIDIKISLYEDNLLTSYTINCPYTFNGRYWNRKCKRECLINWVTISSEENLSDIIEKGKAYYQNTEPSTSDKIDRVVKFKWKIE